MNSAEEGVCCFESIFDYSEFQNDEYKAMFDCKLEFENGDSLPAHRLVLGNCSEFFFNAFTSGMSEDKERVVKIDYNPCNAFPDVFKWMYTGHISVPVDKIVPIISIARYYGIELLVTEIRNFLKNATSSPAFPQNCLIFIRQCYQLELPCELEFLIPFIGATLGKFQIRDLSDNLDVKTFVSALRCYVAPWGEKVNKLHEFMTIGTYEPTNEERVILRQYLMECDPNCVRKCDGQWFQAMVSAPA